ncbi:MAG: hypothetical protein AAGF12_17400 [Myxococcota bacterium]
MMETSLRAALTLLGGLGLLSGCGTGDTQVIVVFDVDESLQAALGELRVEIFDPDGITVGNTTFDLTDPSELPVFGLRLVPRGGDASRRFSLRAELTAANGDSLGTQRVAGRYTEGEVREVWVVFDAGCASLACPSGFRCQNDQCVEECVDPTPPGGVTRSRPFACGTPCTAPSCQGDVIASCEAGALTVERECTLGCASINACQEVLDSNLGRVVGAPPPELEDLVIPANVFAFFDGAGAIQADGNALRGPGDFVNGTRWEQVGVNGQVYDVLTVRNLTIPPESVLSLNGANPYLLLIHGEARIDGRIQLAGRAGAERPGGERGPGGGTDATGVGGGGGGASYGSLGGRGGGTGGARGESYGNPELVPLLPGSIGGNGASGGRGGEGAGAVQVTARTRIVIGPSGDISARGDIGETSDTGPGGGGGSGGGVLLEAPTVILMAGSRERIDATGGDGGLGREGGATLPRARGSESSEPGENGPTGAMSGGGGAGAGRIRINNVDGSGLRTYEEEVAPTGGPLTVGVVGRSPPE